MPLGRHHRAYWYAPRTLQDSPQSTSRRRSARNCPLLKRKKEAIPQVGYSRSILIKMVSFRRSASATVAYHSDNIVDDLRNRRGNSIADSVAGYFSIANRTWRWQHRIPCTCHDPPVRQFHWVCHNCRPLLARQMALDGLGIRCCARRVVVCFVLRHEYPRS